MPIYEYRCDVCQTEVERYEPRIASGTPPEHCHAPMVKIMSAARLEFWGEGAYATEYGTQWRNKWGRAHTRRYEGENFKATEHVRALP